MNLFTGCCCSASIFIVLLFASCRTAEKPPEIAVFKQLKMLMTRQEFNRHIYSLVASDPTVRAVQDDNKPMCEFRESLGTGRSYFGYIIPTFTNNILTELKIFYAPESNPALVTSFLKGEEQILTHWGRATNHIYNDLNLKLQLKYGSQIRSGNEISPHPIKNYEYLFNEWSMPEIKVRLLQKVEHDDGLNNFKFCIFLIEYSVGDEYLKKNKLYISERLKENSTY